MNKKAALEMSVQSIVIFVITFIVVGLLIALIVSMFETIEDNLGIIETPPQVTPSANKPLAVAGDKLVLRTNRDTTSVFGVYLSAPVEMGNILTVEIVQQDTSSPPVWIPGNCTGFGTNATLVFASRSEPAPTNLSAGQTMGIRGLVRTSSPPGTYTCFMRVQDSRTPANVIAFGSFQLEIRN
ncbi:MAG: hypothetical protein ACMXYL_03795 [Candidatus Woesearchaeota archaeon]